MTPDQLGGWIGGTIGCVLGVLGAAIGTYFSIRNARPGKERAYMVRWSIAFGIGVTVFVGLLIALPSPYSFLLWIPYGILLPLTIKTCNKGVARIRAEEAQHDEKDGPADS